MRSGECRRNSAGIWGGRCRVGPQMFGQRRSSRVESHRSAQQQVGRFATACIAALLIVNLMYMYTPRVAASR
jgi:hypothetical protein